MSVCATASTRSIARLFTSWSWLNGQFPRNLLAFTVRHVVKKRPAVFGQETKVGKGQAALLEGSLPILVAEQVRNTCKR